MESINALTYLLQHTATIMHRQADQVLQERLGIGMSQFKILTTLEERANVQQRFLADTLGQTEASISRQIKLLAEKGMLTVDINPKNRRQHGLALTAKGLKVVHAARDIVAEYHAPAFDKMNDKEKQQFAESLQHLHLFYCQEGKPYACDLPWFSHYSQEVV